MKIYKLLLIVFLMFLAGCGTESDPSPTTTPVDNSVPEAANVAAIQLSVDSPTIGTGQSTNVSVLLLNPTGQPVTDTKTVIFSLSNPTLATVSPSATTSSGSLSRTLTAKSTEGEVVLTASVDGKSDQKTIQISNQTAASSLTLEVDPPIVTVGGTSVVSATVLDGNGNPMADGTKVNFSVDNTDLGTIVPTASISGGAGIARATFSAGTTDEGTATITATSGAASNTTHIGVNGAQAGSIEFVSATPQIVVIKGSGGQESSLVQFKVKDSLGNPVVGSQLVNLTLSGPNGGEYIGPNPGIIDLNVGTVNGIASTILHSGTIPGPATIKATVVGTTLSTSSGVIAIGGGIPSAGHFSLAISAFNLAGGEKDGLTADITARIADRYSNYNVLEGTSVSFYSECGAIDRAVNLDAEGYGKVTFRTQNPPPQNVPLSPALNSIVSDYKNKLGVVITDDNNPSQGRCTIIAAVDGEEEFTDSNGDGLYTFEDFTDSNENGKYDLGEPYIDSNDNGSWDSEPFDDTYDDIFLDKDDDPENVKPTDVTANYPFDPLFEDLIVDQNGNGTFDGLNGKWDYNKRIGKRTYLLFTGRPDVSIAEEVPPVPPATDTTVNVINEGDMITIGDGKSKKINFSLHDAKFNPPIKGTTFTVTTDVGGISGKTTYTFPDTYVLGAPIYSVTIFDTTPGDADPPAIGTLEISWTFDGDDYSFSTPISVD